MTVRIRRVVPEAIVRHAREEQPNECCGLLPGSGAVLRRGLRRVAAYRRPSGQVCELSAICPHLGCIVRWDGQSGRFRCACHGGNFDRDGSVLAGPPPRPLDRYAFRVESGRLFVEVG